MKKTYYFIAGLHRSGSTLLSAILNQNPRFHSGPLSPVLPLIKKLESHIQEDEFYQSFPKPDQAHEILSSLIDHYYSDIDKPIIFDKNRIWPRHINYIEGYIKQKAKIICPVRDIDEILVSFLKIIHKNKNEEVFNPIDKQVIQENLPLNDYNRCKIILSNGGNLVSAINSIKYAIDNQLSNRLLFVEYKDIVLSPQLTFNNIYNFLGEDHYAHDFDKIKNNNQVKDVELYNLKGLHDVREKLEIISENPKEFLSDDIIRQCNELVFWREV